MRLAGVLDHENSPLAGNGQDGIHVGGLAKKVNGNDRPGFRRDRRLQTRGIHGAGTLLHIHENRFRSTITDGFRRGDEGGGNRHHFVPRANPARQQGQPKRLRSTAHPGGVFARAKRRELPLELFDERTPDKNSTGNHGPDGVFQLLPQRLVGGGKVKKGNFQRHAWLNRSTSPSRARRDCPPPPLPAARRE